MPPSPDGHWLAITSADPAQTDLWDVQNAQIPQHTPLNPAVRIPHQAHFLPDSKTLILLGDTPDPGSVDRVWFWDLTQPARPPVPLESQGVGIDTIAVSSTGNRLAGVDITAGQLWLWDLSHLRQKPMILSSSPRPGGSPEFSADEHWLATTAGPQVLVWDLHHPQSPPHVLQGDTQRVNRIAFHPNSRYLAGSGENGVVYIWDLQASTSSPLQLQH